MILKASLTLLLCLAALLGDIVVYKSEGLDYLKAIADNGTHALIGGLAWALVCSLQKVSFLTNENILQVTACFVVSSLLDVDHFVMVRSFKLQDVRSMQSRPFLHCSTLAVAAFAGVLGGAWYARSVPLHSAAWLLFMAAATHHTRDATRRGYWCFPLGSTAPLPYWYYIGLTVALPYLVAYLFNHSEPINRYQTVVNLAKSHYITI